MLKLLFALIGIVFGIILARIASEELVAGKKYFIFLKRFLFLLAVVVVIDNLSNILWRVLFLVLAVILVYLDVKYYFKFNLKFKSKINISYLEIGYYLMFIVPYLLLSNQTFRLLLASIIFLYGFPVGTLLYEK